MYGKQYFINFITAIPEEELGAGSLMVDHCVLWHLGVRMNHGFYVPTEPALALIALFGGRTDFDHIEYEKVYSVNDEPDGNAKQNLLTKLNSLP